MVYDHLYSQGIVHVHVEGIDCLSVKAGGIHRLYGTDE